MICHLISWYFLFRIVFHSSARTGPIAVPWRCKKCLLLIRHMCFVNIKSIDSKTNGILNLGWISSLYFNKKHLTCFNPKLCGMFASRSTLWRFPKAAFSPVFLSNLLRKSIVSLMQLFIYCKKGFILSYYSYDMHI